MLGISVLIFVLGACVGSFLNVSIYRIPAQESLLLPPSRCPNCGTRLGIFQLIPIVSYLFLLGRCRSCRAKISWRYPVVEALTGLLFILAWHTYGLSWQTAAAWIFISVLIVVSFIDWDHFFIPDIMLLGGALAGIPILVLQSWATMGWGFAAGLGYGSIMWLIAFISKGGMGGGDVKLAAFMGLFLGPYLGGLALLLGFLIGGLIGIILLFTRKKTGKDVIAFGPYLAMGGLLALLRGFDIINWYLALFT